MTELEELAAETQKIVDVQTSNGNWNYDNYMFGLANGMLLMQAMIEGVEPVFLEATDEWLCDRKIEQPVLVAGGL